MSFSYPISTEMFFNKNNKNPRLPKVAYEWSDQYYELTEFYDTSVIVVHLTMDLFSIGADSIFPDSNLITQLKLDDLEPEQFCLSIKQEYNLDYSPEDFIASETIDGLIRSLRLARLADKKRMARLK